MIVKERRYELNNHELILRSPGKEDAKVLVDYLLNVSAETPYLLNEPEDVAGMTIEGEEKWIDRCNTEERGCVIVAYYDGEYAGNCCITENRKMRLLHRGGVGIALYQKYCGLGIGKLMMQMLFDTAKEIGLEQLELEVIAGNDRALSLYKKFGFVEHGRFPNNMKYKDGTYADAIWMMAKVQ